MVTALVRSAVRDTLVVVPHGGPAVQDGGSWQGRVHRCRRRLRGRYGRVVTEVTGERAG